MVRAIREISRFRLRVLPPREPLPVPAMAPFGSALQNASPPLAYGTRSVDITDFVEILDILSDFNTLNKSHPTAPP